MFGRIVEKEEATLKEHLRGWVNHESAYTGAEENFESESQTDDPCDAKQMCGTDDDRSV